MQEDLGHDRVVGGGRRVDGFLPARGAEAPFAARGEADGAQVVAARGGEVEEGVGEDC